MRKIFLSIPLYIFSLFIFVLLSCIFAYVSIRWPLVHGILISLCVFMFCVFIVLGHNSKGSQKTDNYQMASYCLIIPICFWLSNFVFGMVVPSHRFSETRAFGKYIQNKVPPTLRFSLSDFDSLAVDSKGQVYCYSLFYKRIQLFDVNGQFLRGWFIDIPGGSYHMLVDKNGSIRIASEVSKMDYFFDSYGKLIKETAYNNYNTEFGSTWSNEAKDGFGNVYKIQSPLLFAMVVKITPEGKEFALIKEPYSLWLTRMPLPGGIFLFVSVFFCIIQALIRKIMEY